MEKLTHIVLTGKGKCYSQKRKMASILFVFSVYFEAMKMKIFWNKSFEKNAKMKYVIKNVFFRFDKKEKKRRMTINTNDFPF